MAERMAAFFASVKKTLTEHVFMFFSLLDDARIKCVLVLNQPQSLEEFEGKHCGRDGS